MSSLRRVHAVLRTDLGVLALTIVILGIACGPTPNRKRRDASPISETGGFGGDETGGVVGTGGFGTGGFVGTGGASTGGIGGAGTGGEGTGGIAGTGGLTPDAAVADAAIDAALT